MSNTSVASCSLAQHRVPSKLDNNLVAIQYDHMTTHLNLLICQSLTNANVSTEGGTQCTDACHASLLENTPQVASAAHINDWDPSKFGLGMFSSGFQLLQHFFMFCCFFLPGFFAQDIHTFQDLQVSSSSGKSPNFTRFVHRKSPSPSTRPGQPAFSPPLSPRFGGCSTGPTSPQGSSRASFTSSKATLRCHYGRWPWLRRRRAGRCAAAWKMAFA